MDCSLSLVPFDVDGKLNTAKERILEHVRVNISRQLPQLKVYQPSDEEIILACGGPSLKAHLSELKAQRLKVVSVNGTHDYLVENGINPSIHIMIDGRPFNARFVQKPLETCQYFIASQCHPTVFNALEGYRVHVFHADLHEAIHDCLEAYYFGHFHIVEGGSTVSTRALMLLRMLGFSKIHVYGFDSCLMDGEHHSYMQEENDGDAVIKIVTKPDKREFSCSPWMAKQAQEFQDIVQHRGNLFQLNVVGDGLIAHIIKTGSRLENEDVSLNGQSSGDRRTDRPAPSESEGKAPEHCSSESSDQGTETLS